VHEPLEPATTAHGAVAAFFDVDNTLVRGATLFHLAVALQRRGFVTRADLSQFITHQLRYLAVGEQHGELADLRARALSVLAGHEAAEVAAVAREVCDRLLDDRLYPGALDLLAVHRAAGHQIWLVTATPVEIGQVIADRLAVTGCLATVAERVDGRYTGRLVGQPVHGAAKAARVADLADRLGLDLSASYAYGDSVNDLAILSAVGHPRTVNADARLRRHASRADWPAYDFRAGRRRARRAAQGTALAALGWAATTGVRAARS
jgi:HAD superfamily hydrolase (TIGR01490 family)